MAVCRVKKVELLAHAQSRSEILKALRRQGSVHISDVEDVIPESDDYTPVFPAFIYKSIEEVEATLVRLRFCSEFLKRFAPAPSFLEGLLHPKPVFTDEELDQVVADFPIKKFHDSLKEFKYSTGDAESQIERNEALIHDIQYWEKLDCPLERVRDTSTTRVRLGICEAGAYDPMIEELSEATTLFEVEIVDRSAASVSMIISYHASAEEIADAILRQHGWRAVRFPGIEGTPAEALDALRKHNEDLRNNIGDIHDRIAGEFLPSARNLLLLLDHYAQELETLKIQRRFFFTANTFLISGWIVASREEALRERLDEITPGYEMQCSDPGPDDNPPTLIANRPSIAPFGLVTELYGQPQYGEFDPTPLLAPFFAIFFGICLGDGGYGLILAGASFFALKKLQVEGGARKLLQILVWSGLASAVVGLFTGGFFAIEPESLPAVLRAFIIFNPTRDVTTFLFLSFAIGVFHILFGFGIKLVWNLRNGNMKDAILDQGLWMLYVAALVPLLYKNLFGGDVSEAIISIALPSYVVFLVLLILFEGREQKFIPTRLALGLLKVFKSTIDYFGDVLSYARLMALGLASAFLGIVINQMASLVMDVPFFIGYLLAALLLVGGHLFNLVINCLSAFVHTLRLQYLEFFSKFFVGGGEAFKPFSENRKHTVIRPAIENTLQEPARTR